MSSAAPFGAIVSSVAPSVATVVARIVWLIVSPVVRAAAMIVVPSISPTTMSALPPRRRRTLRTASFTRMRFTDAEGCQRAQRDAEPDEEDDEERVDRDAEDFLHRLRHQDARHDDGVHTFVVHQCRNCLERLVRPAADEAPAHGVRHAGLGSRGLRRPGCEGVHRRRIGRSSSGRVGAPPKTSCGELRAEYLICSRSTGGNLTQQAPVDRPASPGQRRDRAQL